MAYFNSSSLSLCTTMNGEGGKKKNLSGWRMGIYHRLCVSPPVYGRPGRWHDVRLISEKKKIISNFPCEKKTIVWRVVFEMVRARHLNFFFYWPVRRFCAIARVFFKYFKF